RNPNLDSHIGLHSITPDGRLQLPAYPRNSIRPDSMIAFRRAEHFYCSFQAQPGIAVGEGIELRVRKGVGAVV
ncbi:hypothetical protein SUNI508_14104, partial [Seiridium unicorne]